MNESADQVVATETPPEQQHKEHDDSITDASTEVLVVTTMLDRLATLHDADTPIASIPASGLECSTGARVVQESVEVLDKATPDDRLELSETKQPDSEISSTIAPQPEPISAPVGHNNEATPDNPIATLGTPLQTPTKKPERSAELTQSILAGEVSDNSECSVEVDSDEDGDHSEPNRPKDVDAPNGKATSSDVSDEEMYIEDQNEEEDVEEEEEFHDIEEEKHKTSQEFVDADKSSPQSGPPSSKSTSALSRKNSDDVCFTESSDSTKQPIQDGEQHSESPKESSENLVINDSAAQTTNAKQETEGDQLENGLKPKASDWADIMLSNIQTASKAQTSEDSKLAETPADKEVLFAEQTSEGFAATNPLEGADGQENSAEKKELDLDEDVKNPQYIPKKGVFYEHDDRSHDVKSDKPNSTSTKPEDDGNEPKKESSHSRKATVLEKPNEDRRNNRRQQRTEADRWNHDLFRDEKQKPKSKTELISAYGYDIRQDRSGRNQGENRQKSNNTNNNNSDRQQGGQVDNQRSRQSRDNRASRQGQASNRSRERKPRRQNNRNRTDTSLGTPSRRDGQHNNRSSKNDIKLDNVDGHQQAQQQIFSIGQQNQSNFQSNRRDNHDGSARERNNRNENRNRRQNSKDRPNANLVDHKLPPITTVMPPITTWSNKIEDMVKEEASLKESPSRHEHQTSINSSGAGSKTRGISGDQWPVSNPNKSLYQDRPTRGVDENRQHQHYNNRGRYQDNDGPRQMQFVNRNHYADRTSQHNPEWRRNNNYNSYSKQNEPIKTQTFENSRLSQSNTNRTLIRDGRDIINERRMQGQQGFQPKGLSNPSDQQLHQQRQLQHQQYLHQLAHQNSHQHQKQLAQQLHQQSQQMMQQQQLASQHLRQQQQSNSPHQQQLNTSNQQTNLASQSAQKIPNARHQSATQQTTSSQTPPQSTQTTQQHSNHARPSMPSGVVADGVQDASRMSAPSASATTTIANELVISRPIIKTDTYTGTSVPAQTHSHQSIHQQPQHSQNHRALGGSVAPVTAGATVAAPSAHITSSHMGTTGAQAQYYPPSNNSRDSAVAAAAMASAYHGYMSGAHSVMDTSRYHMTSQQMSDHGYMTAGPGQAADVAAPLMHQPGMYADASGAGGTVASSAYMAQAGSTMSPSTNIPVTGAGPPPPMPPVSYLQHSQYAPPPYSNPYSQPQHNHQAPPPQSSHGYPYWAYI